MGGSKKQPPWPMNTHKLIINPFAEMDLQISQDWYNLQKEGLGKEFTLEVDKIIIRIAQNPRQFAKVKLMAIIAVLQRFPFGVYYIIHASLINVFAVFNFSRNPAIWKKRL